MPKKTSSLLMESEFKEWLEHPITKDVKLILQARISELKNKWASGAFTDMSQYGTAILNAKAIGTCEAFDRVIGLDYVQFSEDILELDNE